MTSLFWLLLVLARPAMLGLSFCLGAVAGIDVRSRVDTQCKTDVFQDMLTLGLILGSGALAMASVSGLSLNEESLLALYSIPSVGVVMYTLVAFTTAGFSRRDLPRMRASMPLLLKVGLAEAGVLLAPIAISSIWSG